MARSLANHGGDDFAERSPETVQASLTELLARTGADELRATMQMYRLEDGIRSLELLTAMSGSADSGEAPA